MFKRTITYFDYDGNEKKEEHYFHMSQLELSEFMLSYPNGIREHIADIFKRGDNLAMIQLAKDLVRRSYGVKNQNGSFVKRQDLVDDFVYSPAFDELVLEMLTEPDAVDKFMSGIIPKNLANEIENNPNLMKQAEAEANKLFADSNN